MLPLYVEMTLFSSRLLLLLRPKESGLTKKKQPNAHLLCGFFLQFPDEATPLISCQSACLCGPISVRLTSTTVTCRTCGTFKKSKPAAVQQQQLLVDDKNDGDHDVDLALERQ